MRIGGGSDPDSDVLQLVAGVKKKTLCQPLSCMRCIYARMHACTRMFVYSQCMSLCTLCLCTWVCALVTVYEAFKPLHVTRGDSD